MAPGGVSVFVEEVTGDGGEDDYKGKYTKGQGDVGASEWGAAAVWDKVRTCEGLGAAVVWSGPGVRNGLRNGAVQVKLRLSHRAGCVYLYKELQVDMNILYLTNHGN